MIVVPLSITQYAFENAINLRKVVLSSVSYISSYAFKGCVNLQEVVIDSSVSYIYDDVFADCNSLKKITYTGDVDSWKTCYKSGYWDRGRVCHR